jgi:ATP-dependent DNA helicase RecG
MIQLHRSLDTIKGVGEKTAAIFSKAGLRTISDLLYFFPKSYDDFSNVVTADSVKPGKVTLKVHIHDITTRRVRRGMHITSAVLTDETSSVLATWFNQPYRADQLRNSDSKRWLVSGDYGLSGTKYQLVNPSVEALEGRRVTTGRVSPNYRSLSGLKSHLVRKVILELKPLITMIPETLPDDIVARYGLISHSQALLYIHFPTKMEDITQAQERLGFEELLCLSIAAQLNKRDNNKLDAWHIPFDTNTAQQFVSHLPFIMTDDQRAVVWQILQHFDSSPYPMNRLMQGDVGSGKTVVGAMCAAVAAHAGFQTAFMAPTEILAMQHADSLQKLVAPRRVGLLTSSIKSKSRQQLYDAVKTGEVDILVGTHALIQDAVKFHRLGFVVIDEQHRFGVAQRQALLEKSSKLPHLLMMTATPIPRSLALTVYGELDISTLRHAPKGRKPIKTTIISPNSRQSMYIQVDAEIEQGRQAYVVCPLIDDSVDSEKRSAEAEYIKLRRTIFKHRRIGLLHGLMKASEKQQIMKQFASHELDILIATTVIEVGVDVPNATIMIIENADQFGLAQAHQLRGRVGRGVHQSYCYLVSSDSLKPTRRLKELAKSNDGFYLSEIDLSLRGPGEIYGHAQHGQLNLKMAQLSDTRMIARAQKAAEEFMKSSNDLIQYPEMKRQVERYQRITTLN